MNDERELIDRLCAAAGMIMEDASAMAVEITHDADELRAKLAALRRCASDIVKILEAAAVLVERQTSQEPGP